MREIEKEVREREMKDTKMSSDASCCLIDTLAHYTPFRRTQSQWVVSDAIGNGDGLTDVDWVRFSPVNDDLIRPLSATFSLFIR